MKVVVTGATGNVGTALVRAFAEKGGADQVVALSRRPPSKHDGLTIGPAEWIATDVTSSDMEPLFRGADVVVHLAWAIQPSRRDQSTLAVNVGGTDRVLRAVTAAKVPAVVVASSVGAYSPGPKSEPVDESWPTHGIATLAYSRQKAYVERMLDAFECSHPSTRVVRLRPGLIFRSGVASEIRRFFLGPFAPTSLARHLPLVPSHADLKIQAVHSDDVAEAYRLAAVSDVRGAFNIAAEPVVDPEVLAAVFGARTVPVPGSILRAAAAVTWRLRLQPTSPGWVELALTVPLMSVNRARTELGWSPVRSSDQALAELVEGWSHNAGEPTPTLAPSSLAGRLVELRSGVGGSQNS